MRFGLVARLTLALALLVLAVFALKLFYYKPPVGTSGPVVQKQKITHKFKTPDFAAIKDVRTKKKAFFDFIRPGVVQANRDIARQRQFLLDIVANIENGAMWNDLSVEQLQRITEIALRFKAKTLVDSAVGVEQLLIRVDTIPRELVMVQAANESGWGTSRFARLGLNFFGQWCFSKGCGLVPSSRNDDANHEVRVFESVDASIASYLSNLNTHPAYNDLRQIRLELRQNNLPVKAEFLAPGLLNYSERQQDYVVELLQMLRHNKAYL